MIRAALIAAVVLVAILVTPAALAPVFNSADIIVILSPFAVAGIGLARRPHLIERIPDTHPAALSGWERSHGLPDTERTD